MPLTNDRRLLATLVLTLAAACGLVPTRTTECSASRPCADGQTCDPETSTCRESREPDPLPACRDACRPCQSHSDCESQVCDVYQVTALGGTCVPTTTLVYVDNRGGACKVGQGDGESPKTALCTLAEGLARVDGARKTAVRVMASRAGYGPLVIDGASAPAFASPERVVTLYGPAPRFPQPDNQALFGQDRDQDGVGLQSGARVILDGLSVSRARVGVSCTGPAAQLTLRRSRVQGCGDLGLLALNCALVVDRVLLQGNDNGALAVGGDQPFTITNSFITRNAATTSPAVKLDSSGMALFRFNTVADNQSTLGAAAIDCAGRPSITISRSLVVKNGKGVQLQGGCRTFASYVTGLPGEGFPREPAFVTLDDIDYALDPRSCCIDKVPCAVPTDYFGTRRPLGLSCDQGAHEVR